MPPKLTTDILLTAIDGFEEQKRRIDVKIAGLRQVLSTESFLRRKGWRLIVPPVGRQSALQLTRPRKRLDRSRPSHGSSACSDRSLATSHKAVSQELPQGHFDESASPRQRRAGFSE
jgi:hypothetical protein